MNVVYIFNNTFFILKCEGTVKKSHSLRIKAAAWSCDIAGDTFISFGRQQQVEQAVRWDVLLYFWGPCKHLNSLTSLIIGENIPFTLNAVVPNHCRDFLGWALHVLCQSVMFPVRAFFLFF